MLFRSAIRVWLWTGLCVMGWSPIPSYAQSRTVVGVGENFRVEVTAKAGEGQPTAVRLRLDGIPVGPDALLSGTLSAIIPVPAIAVSGAHRLEAASVNEIGPGPWAALDFWVGPPSAPTFKILQVVTTQVFEQVPREGGVELRLVRTSTDVSAVK